MLFKPFRIKGMNIPNRFVRSATYDGSAEKNGSVSERQIALYEELAKGGVGLIVTGISFVHPEGRISHFQNSIADDRDIDGLRRLTRCVHRFGAKIAVQLFHAGREKGKVYPKRPALAPSLVSGDPFFSSPHREMSEEEIRETIHAFSEGARRAREADFDAVQIHGAHAYLLSQFLSPFTNRREDQWGGSLQNRLRLHREIVRAVRASLGDDFPLLIKLGVEDGFAGGLEFREGLMAAEILAGDGVDSIEVSLGLRGRLYDQSEYRSGINRPEREAYYRHWSREIRGRVNLPVIAVGGVRSFETAEDLIRREEADLVSLSRPFIREPDLVRRWQAGDRRPSTCASCNRCMEALLEAKPLACYEPGSGTKEG